MTIARYIAGGNAEGSAKTAPHFASVLSAG
jgi:hypothetical protein